MTKTHILIIGVIYNSYSETIRYLESLMPLMTEDTSLILVDNSDIEKPSNFLEKIKNCPYLQYIETRKNLGYFGGAREGLTRYLQKHPAWPCWVLVTNVDIVFTTPFFERLNELKDRQNLGIVAPSIISAKWNTDYNPKLLVRNSNRKIRFYRLLYSSFLFHNLFLAGVYIRKWIRGMQSKEKHFERKSELKSKKIFAPHGSCIVFKDTYFKMGGTLDLSNFLFGEEIFVAETAARLGLDVIYDPELLIRDYEHASVGFFVTPKMNRYYRESIQNILKMYYQ